MLPDPSTPFGERVRRRLREETLIWLTTVGRDGRPQPNPVWFWWDGRSLLVYNRADAGRVRHVRDRPGVSLHFDSNGTGGDIVVIAADAEIAEGEPPAHEMPEYLDKYGQRMAAISGGPERFSEAYPVPMRIHPRRARGF